jgi:hypothetical protein
VIFALIAMGTYLFLIRPIIDDENRLKPIMLETSNQLMKCSFDSKEIEKCYIQKTSKDFQGAISLNQYIAMIGKVKEKLGNRLTSELVDDKFNLIVIKGNNSGKRVEFILKVAYQNDIFANETYVYSLDQTANEYKLYSIRFNSDKLLD